MPFWRIVIRLSFCCTKAFNTIKQSVKILKAINADGLTDFGWLMSCNGYRWDCNCNCQVYDCVLWVTCIMFAFVKP